MNQEFECRGTVSRAVAFAAAVLDGRPDLAQAMEAYTVAAGITGDADVQAAAALHGAARSCGEDAVRARFGERIARLTRAGRADEGADGWQKSRLRAVRKMSIADQDEQQVILAVHLSELRALGRGLSGQDAGRINLTMRHWYHTSVAQALSPLARTAAYREYRALIGEIFGEARVGK